MRDGADRQRLLDAWLALTGPDPDFAGTVRLPMLTGSMAPRVPIGAELVIASARRHVCRSGDVVVFRRDDRLVAHRVLLVLGRGPGAWLLEKGDRNVGAGWVRRRDVRGVVVDRIPTDPRRTAWPLRGRGTVRASILHSVRTVVRRLLGREGR